MTSESIESAIAHLERKAGIHEQLARAPRRGGGAIEAGKRHERDAAAIRTLVAAYRAAKA